MYLEPRVLARNTTYFVLALITQKVISFLYFTYLARIFLPEDIGKYVFTLSFTAIFSVLIDVGLGYVLITEVSKDKFKAQSYWQNVIGFKIIALLVAVGLIFLLINLLNYPLLTRQLVYIASIMTVLDSLVFSAYSLIRAFQNLLWESLGTVLFQIVVALSGFTILQLSRDLRWLILALIIGGLVNLIYSWYKLKVKYEINLWPKFDKDVIKYLLILAWPFGLTLILTRIYSYLDTVLLSLLAGDREVGFYSVAYKITFAFQFIPSAFAASLLAGFSAFFVSSQELLYKTFAKSIHYLNLISFPLATGIIVLAPSVIPIIYPKYGHSILPLQILMLSLIFLFLTFPVGSLLSAGNKQRRNTSNLAITVIVSIIMNFILIPKYGAVGAAISSLASSIIYFLLGLVVVPSLIKVDFGAIGWATGKIFLAAVIMSLVIYILLPLVNLFLLVIIGAVVYALAILLLRALALRELSDFLKIVFKRQQI